MICYNYLCPLIPKDGNCACYEHCKTFYRKPIVITYSHSTENVYKNGVNIYKIR